MRGGHKPTTARVLSAFVKTRFTPGNQSIIKNRAAAPATLNNAITLFIFAVLTIVVAAFVLLISESKVGVEDVTHHLFLSVLFEVTSAFGNGGV